MYNKISLTGLFLFFQISMRLLFQDLTTKSDVMIRILPDGAADTMQQQFLRDVVFVRELPHHQNIIKYAENALLKKI